MNTIEALKFSIEGLGRTRVWKLCLWVCGVGLAHAIDAVSSSGAQLWTESGIPLMAFQFYNIVHQHDMLCKSDFLESRWKVCGGGVVVRQPVVPEHAFMVSPRTSGMIHFVPCEGQQTGKATVQNRGWADYPFGRGSQTI